ncbi:Cell division trigger factor [hydrothermal vent metagenome]|uniref:peptidylprolyl isomerase n=1 Tax=hydrothermal vent metagenome TaxID=652676 RepID=A0A3B0U6R8_9ZZZZ
MNITKENIDETNAVIKIAIEKADYEGSVNDVLKDYRQKASIPGFRPGKVPMGLIQKRFGKAILAEEINKVLSKNLSKFIIEEKLPILGEPLPNEGQQKTIDWEKDEEFEFVFDVAIAPEIKVTLDKRSKYKYYVIKVDDKMIDRQIEDITASFGSNKPIDEVVEKATVKGDFAQLDDEGNVLEGGISPSGVSIAVDIIKDEGIKKEFIGRKKGGTLVFDPVKAFDNRHEVGHMLNISHEEAEALDARFNYTITEILQFEKAEVNEELFKKVYGEDSGITTIEAFREKIKTEMATNLAYSSDHKFTLDTRDILLEKTNIELPEAFLKRWLKVTNKELAEEQIENDFSNFAKDLRWQLIKDFLAKENEISVTEDEALELARQIAFAQFNQYGMYNITPEQLDSFAKMMLDKEEEKEKIYKKLYEDKIIKTVKEKVNIEEVEVTQEEFTEMMK